MKDNKMELENEKQREIDKEKYNKMVQEFNGNVKKSNSWKKNKCLLTVLKYVFLTVEKNSSSNAKSQPPGFVSISLYKRMTTGS